MDSSAMILLVLAIVAFVCAFIKDRSLPIEGLYAGGRLFRTVWVEVLLGFIIAGLLEVLLSPAEITLWLGTDSSMRGILVGWGVGLIIPGGPYLLFPVAAGLLKAGAAPGALIALITAKTLIGPIRLLTYEAPLLGWPFTVARCLPAMLIPPLMGLAGQWVFDLMKKYT